MGTAGMAEGGRDSNAIFVSQVRVGNNMLKGQGLKRPRTGWRNGSTVQAYLKNLDKIS